MSNNPSVSSVQSSNSTSVSPQMLEKPKGPSKSPYSSFYGSGQSGYNEYSMSQSTYGSYPPQGYGQHGQDIHQAGVYGQYGQSMNAPSGYGQAPYGNQSMYGTPNNFNVGSQPIQPAYNHHQPSYNQQQNQQTAPITMPPQAQQGSILSQTQTQANAQPFSFFPTLDAANKTGSPLPKYSPVQTDQTIPIQPSNPIQPNNYQPAANVQSQINYSFVELQKLKNRYHSLAHRNPDILPDQFKNAFKFTSFFKSATIISIFFYSAFKSSYLIQSGADKKLLFMRALNFFFAYMVASVGFNILEGRQLERAFHYSYGGMSIPMIDAELKRISEANPILKY
jgi:hypothetical protein